jgi:hypothetical protein
MKVEGEIEVLGEEVQEEVEGTLQSRISVEIVMNPLLKDFLIARSVMILLEVLINLEKAK